MGRKKKIDTLKITANGSHSEEVKNGNEVANASSNLTEQIEQLFKTDRKKFLGFIRQRVRSQEEAEDILQDVFTNVLAASANVQKPIENIASWVFTAVRNRIIDSYRKITNNSFNIRFFQVDKISDKIYPIKLKAAFWDLEGAGEKISNEQVFVVDKDSDNADERIIKLSFALKQKSFDKEKDYYLILSDYKTGLEYLKIAFKIDILIENLFSDFD